MLQERDALKGIYSLDANCTLAPLDAKRFESTAATKLNTSIAIYAAIEFLAVACSSYFAMKIYHYFVYHASRGGQAYVFAAFGIATLVCLTSLGLGNISTIRRQPRHVFILRSAGPVFLAFLLFLTALFFMQLGQYYSRGTLVFQVIGIIIAVACTRAAFYSWLHSAISSNRIEARSVVLIGDTANCLEVSHRLKTSGIRTVGNFRLPRSCGMEGANKPNQKISEIIAHCRSHPTDDIIILTNKANLPKTFEIAELFAELPIAINIVPMDALEVLSSSRIIEYGYLKTLQVHRPPLSISERIIKRSFDIFAASIALIVLSPLIVVISIAIKLDSAGPVFFRQKRHGFNNEEIRVFKFRSMTSIEDGDRFTQAVVNDQRVTRVGRIIRVTNIDELPQLLNVLRGEMSLVGPRPHATAQSQFFNKMIRPFSRRHNVKPGITGWAQVNGHRGPIDTLEKMQRRIEYDLYYIDNWSFVFDMKIIIMTVFTKRAYTNAY
jgi:Undecaprenyl-phosphate glucose phosphotransferase